MCPYCKKAKLELGQQTCRVCQRAFPICVDCLWAVNDVCGLCGQVKCPECWDRKETCRRDVAVAREGSWGPSSVNTIQMPRVEVGVMTWNINHFENLPVEKSKAVHRLFELHPWLDVLVLQEINASATLTISGNELVMEKGPKITSLSQGKEPKSDKAATWWDKDVKAWITPRQQEYYPIIYRQSTTQYLRSAGLSHAPGENATAPGEFYWTKSKILKAKYSPYRPVIVHAFLIQGQPVHIAVVHTTPEGDGLSRKGEFQQVLPMLDFVSKASGYWIVAGDYYLDPEATTQTNTKDAPRDLEELFNTKVSELGLTFAISISATNQSKLQHGLPVIRDRVKRLVDGEEWVVVNKRADFFLHNQAFVRSQAGVVSPRGGLLQVDPDHQALNWWRETSDHAPVGAILSSTQRCVKIDELEEEKWLQPGVMEEAQAQLGKLYREAAYRAAGAVKTMVLLITQYPDKPSTRLPVVKRFCCLAAELSYTWGDWVAPYVDSIRKWKAETAHVSLRQAMELADQAMRLTTTEIEKASSGDEVRGEMILAIIEARKALSTLDYDCINIDVTDEKDDYRDVSLI